MHNANSIALDIISDAIERSDVDIEDNLADFCEKRQFIIDGRPFDLSKYPYLEPIYRDCLTAENLSKPNFDLVLMFAAQTGKTVLMSAAMIYLQLLFKGSAWGYYFPVQQLARLFSTERYKRILDSNVEIARIMTGDQGDMKQNAEVRHLGLSSCYFLWTSGKATTESFPFWGVAFDEVRRMQPGEIIRAEQRIAASDYKINMKSSTANFPSTDIHEYFIKSNQNYWHTECKCADGVVLTDHWPDCMVKTRKKWRLYCPICDTIIKDPQAGHYVPKDPNNTTHGYTIPRLINPNADYNKMMEDWRDTKDRKEFYNSGLGLPYIDSQTQPVSEATFMACIDEDLHWQRHSSNPHNYMGVDQRGGENHVVIGQKEEGKRAQLLHIETIQDDAPFNRLYQLMIEFNIACAVVDENPNFNEARRFAKKHPGRVFLCTYGSVAEVIRWGDKLKLNESQRKTKDEDQFQYFVRADRYKTIDAMMQHFVMQEIGVPPPSGLIQEITVKGHPHPIELALGDADLRADGLLYHLRSVARAKTRIYKRGDNNTLIDTGQDRMEWQNLRGIDPHFVHALNYMWISMERQTQTTKIYGVETEEVPDQWQSVKKQVVEQKMTMLPQNKGVTCATCVHFVETPEPGKPSCPFHNVNTRATDNVCDTGYEDKQNSDAGGSYIVF